MRARYQVRCGSLGFVESRANVDQSFLKHGPLLETAKHRESLDAH